MAQGWNPETVLDVLGCEIARSILALASIRPLSAEELADYCDVSEASVYRRIHELQEYDMLEKDLEINTDGNNYNLFTTNLETMEIQLDEGRFDIKLHHEKDYTEKFSDFWADLEAGVDEIDIDPISDSESQDSSLPDTSGA